MIGTMGAAGAAAAFVAAADDADALRLGLPVLLAEAELLPLTLMLMLADNVASGLVEADVLTLALSEGGID